MLPSFTRREEKIFNTKVSSKKWDDGGEKLSHTFWKNFPPYHIFQNFLSFLTRNLGICWRNFLTSFSPFPFSSSIRKLRSTALEYNCIMKITWRCLTTCFALYNQKNDSKLEKKLNYEEILIDLNYDFKICNKVWFSLFVTFL